jgi:hypothetical protein
MAAPTANTAMIRKLLYLESSAARRSKKKTNTKKVSIGTISEAVKPIRFKSKEIPRKLSDRSLPNKGILV